MSSAIRTEPASRRRFLACFAPAKRRSSVGMWPCKRRAPPSFFSNSQLAMCSRTVGFLAQKFFPPGIDGREHGPYFGFQEAVTALKLQIRRGHRRRCAAISREIRTCPTASPFFPAASRFIATAKSSARSAFPATASIRTTSSASAGRKIFGRIRYSRGFIHVSRRASALREIPARSGAVKWDCECGTGLQPVGRSAGRSRFAGKFDEQGF